MNWSGGKKNLLKIFRIYTILILTTRQHYLVQGVFVDVHEQYIYYPDHVVLCTHLYNSS